MQSTWRISREKAQLSGEHSLQDSRPAVQVASFAKRGLDVGGDAGDFFPDHQFVDVVGAFIGVHAFQIVHVAHDAVIVDDAVSAENVARLAGNVQGDRNVIHFQHGDVRR